MTRLWLIVAVAGIGTFLLRYSFFALFERVDEIPPPLLRALRYVPAAVLAALVVPAVITGGGDTLTVAPEHVVAGGVAALVAWRTESVLWTIVTGMTVLTVLTLAAGTLA